MAGNIITFDGIAIRDDIIDLDAYNKDNTNTYNGWKNLTAIHRTATGKVDIQANAKRCLFMMPCRTIARATCQYSSGYRILAMIADDEMNYIGGTSWGNYFDVSEYCDTDYNCYVVFASESVVNQPIANQPEVTPEEAANIVAIEAPRYKAITDFINVARGYSDIIENHVIAYNDVEIAPTETQTNKLYNLGSSNYLETKLLKVELI